MDPVRADVKLPHLLDILSCKYEMKSTKQGILIGVQLLISYCGFQSKQTTCDFRSPGACSR